VIKRKTSGSYCYSNLKLCFDFYIPSQTQDYRDAWFQP